MELQSCLPTLVGIPTQPFLLGTPERDLSNLAKQYGGTRESYREESPQHRLVVPPFAIAQMPVTNALYGCYVTATSARAPLNWRGTVPPADRVDHPVVDVSWEEATQFCSWLSTVWATADTAPQLDVRTGTLQPGSPTARLPSEAEWEYAARGTDGRTFPWGEQFDTTHANTRETGIATTTPGHAYPSGASPFGVLGMAGNVWEWTSTIDTLYPYVVDARESPDASGRRVLRGGCYANPHGYARSACRFRLLPHVRNDFTGFRVAVDLDRS